MARTLAASVALALAVFGCGGPDPCGDGVAMPGEVCLVQGPPLADGEHAQALMDFDADGLADLIGLHESLVRLLRGRGDATFEPVGDVAYDSLGGIPFVLRDVDGDGRDELAVRADESGEDGAPTELHIFERDLAGQLRLEHTLVVPLPSPGVLEVVGDFEGDGSRDLVLYGAHVVTLVPGTSDGPGDPVAVEPFGINSNGILQLDTGDLDGDGADELCHPRDDVLLVRSGPVLGTLEMLALPNAAPTVALGDIDGDGTDEVIAWEKQAGRAWIEGHVLKLDPSSRTLVTLSTFQSEGQSLFLADVDGDGMEDVALPGEETEEESRSSFADPGKNGRVRLAVGDGELASPVEVAGLIGRDWRPAHLDDDGVLDLAGFGYGDPSCGLPECSFYFGALSSAP
jgi:hypothetical protein